MKDITHYFTDLPRKAESASTAVKEVRAKRAKIEDATTAAVAASEEPKRKRGRVKIKISRSSDEGAVCDILNSSSDLVDKTPSPYEKRPRKRQLGTASSEDSKTANGSCKITNGLGGEARSGVWIPDGFADSFSSADLMDTETVKRDDEDKSSAKKDKINRTEKLIELANTKGYSKRKVREEEEAAKIEKRLEKRKKLFTIEPDKNSEVCDENTQKNDTPNTKKSSLLNYFSKSTPEQLERERLMNAKVTIKADVHTPLNSPVPVAPVFDKKTKNLQKKKAKSNSKQLQEDTDEIFLIQSETVILSPKNEKISIPLANSKPKWSLKIQLQSNNIRASDDDIDEIYTPTLPSKLQKENIKNNDKIPKILLPMKNKKTDSNKSPTNENVDTNKKEEKQNSEVSIQKENIKNNDKIPKILLPMKNKKTDSVKSPTNENVDKNKKEEKQSSEVSIKKQNSKTESKQLKTESNKRKTRTGSTEEIEIVYDNDISSKKEIIDEDCEIIEENPVKNKNTGILAPLFKKKSKPNPEAVAARRLFLQSDIQENSNGNETRKAIPTGPIILPFPKISHINQFSSDNSNGNETYNFSFKSNTKIRPSYDLSYMKTVSNLHNKADILESPYECVKSDIQTVLSEVESYYSDASNLWKFVSMLIKSEAPKKTPRTRRKIDKKNSKESNNDIQNNLLNSSWTDKYKPNSSAEVVGNEEAAQKLKSWLESWKALKNNLDYSSSEEFYTSDCSASNNFENNQVAVLVGPHGCGKTATVYAVAHELGYKVLEVNASSKRPGKKILKDFEEATKSHRVKKTNLKDVFAPVSKKSDETKKISQNSLILMEDVDLVFEEDEGFVSAAFQLASNTKRPIVMTLRDTCFHLSKLAPQQLRIDFKPVTGKKVTALFQLIALAETECKLSRNCIDALCQNGDLRKSLLQLQYLLLSNKEHISFTALAVNNSSWKDMQTYIYKPAIKADKSNKKKQESGSKINNILNNLVNSLDNFSLVSTLINIEDPTSHSHNLKTEPNLSFSENTSSYSNLEGTSLEISNWLNDSIKKLNQSKKLNNQMGTNNCQLLTKKQVITDVDSILSQIASNTLDRRALAVDYLSSIRTICRSEEIRNQLNSKRGNRFFHYFQSSRLSTGMTKSGNIVSAACKMLQEKSTAVET